MIAAVASEPQLWWQAPAVVAALVATFAGVFTLWVNGRRARIDRQRVLFADAFGVVAEYREFPYIVRRRRHDDPEGERARINAELSDVQHRLNRYTAVLRVEDKAVGEAYEALVAETRRIAGGAIREAWGIEPITADTAMSIVDIDLSPIKVADDCYLGAVRKHLRLAPAWMW